MQDQLHSVLLVLPAFLSRYLLEFCLVLPSGVNALTALHIGSKDDEGVKRTVHTAVIICLAGGILITVFGILFSHNILVLMNTKDELIDGAVLYLRIYLLG